MLARETNRERPSNLPRIIRRSRTTVAVKRRGSEGGVGGGDLAPRFSKLVGGRKLKLEAPEDCVVSVIFKRVGEGDNGGGLYVFWLLAGRFNERTMTAQYRSAAGDIRCDIPQGGARLSSVSLQADLQRFLSAESFGEDPPPTLDP